MLHADTGFDWSELRQNRDSLSLFAEKRLVDLRFGRTKFDRAGAQALLHYAERPNPDCVLLLSAGALDWREQRARWFRAFETVGAVIQTWPVPPRQLPRWIAERGRRRGLASMADAVSRGENESRVLARHRVRDRRRELVGRALRRHRPGTWTTMLRQAAHLDRVIKGAERGTAWDEAARLALMLAGASILRAKAYD